MSDDAAVATGDQFATLNVAPVVVEPETSTVRRTFVADAVTRGAVANGVANVTEIVAETEPALTVGTDAEPARTLIGNVGQN